jgi:hypothetical protein
MNPILPIQHGVPDAEARQCAGGRIYLYGSYDISGRTSYCGCLISIASGLHQTLSEINECARQAAKFAKKMQNNCDCHS